jgi:hypothetical protein
MATDFDITDTDQTAEVDGLKLEELEELELAEPGAAELDAVEDEAAAAGEQDAHDSPPFVFISYSRRHDEKVARHIYEALTPHCKVYLDQETNNVGDDYVARLEEWLDRADFFVILISKGSLESGWVVAELAAAAKRQRESGRPAVLPVCVEYTGAYPLDVSAYIGRTHALFWDSRNVAAHVARLRAVVLNEEPPTPRPLNAGMDGMLVSDNRRARYAAAFVAPRGLEDEGLLRERKLLWLTGDADVRNYAALSLAARDPARTCYEVAPARTWGEVNNTGVSDAAIVLRDAAPAARFNEVTAGEELNSLRALIERGNVVVATASDDEFERVRQEMFRYEFGAFERRGLGRSSFGDEAKLSMLDRLLDFSLRSYDVTEEQAAWVRKLEAGDRLVEAVKRWGPSDIESFVTYSLPQAQRPGDVSRLLRRNAALEEEMHEWFLSLDDSTRCFVLAFALFPETESDFLWEKYKGIGKELRRLDPQLSLRPFGVCRQRAARYLSSEGAIYARDERVADAIRMEIARNYREYFVELTEKLKEWTVPDHEGRAAWPQEPRRKQKAKDGRPTRAAVARMVGCVGRVGFGEEKLTKLLEFWATDPNFHVRRAVADALAQTAQGHNGVSHALAVLEPWCREARARGDSKWRACAAAVALGDIASPRLNEETTPRLLDCVRRLARSPSRDVRFHVSIALRNLARGLPFADVEGILMRVAAEKSVGARVGVRVNVADALNAARERDPAADDCWRAWFYAEDEGRRWSSLCALLIDRDAAGRVPSCPDKYELLFELLACEEMADNLLRVCAQVLPQERHGETAADTFKRLSGEATGEPLARLAAALTRLPRAYAKRLMPLVRTHGSPALEELLVELWADELKQMTATPPLFVNSLKEWMARDELRPEMFKTLALLFGQGPASGRPQTVWALADGYAQDPEDVDALLGRLAALAPTYFDSLAESVARQSLAGNSRPDGLRRISIRKPGTAAERPRPTFVKRLVKRLIKFKRGA